MVSKCNSTCPYDRGGGERERLRFDYRREVVDITMEGRGCSDFKKGHEPRKAGDFQKL